MLYGSRDFVHLSHADELLSTVCQFCFLSHFIICNEQISTVSSSMWIRDEEYRIKIDLVCSRQ